MSEETYTEAEAHRHFAGQLNGEVWRLFEKTDRSQTEDALMIHAAHASCYHWLQVGTGLHHQRAEWLISHVYAELGLGEPALRHARRCQALTKEHTGLMHDFDRAYAHEGMARAHAVARNREEALKYLALAEAAGQAIADDEDRQIFLDDLNSGDWSGVRGD